MPATASSHRGGTVHRSDENPATPWHDFGSVMEQMLDLLDACHSPGQRSEAEEDEAYARDL
ncbi:hypothetical protein AB0953_22630 [Streptomyces sp. NPDC046866]|uniref:hypothetical protein n=1 Tax=Streptomyces sp. NPDC046866 TaxID=3154921 RepID=UPI003454E596